MSLYKIQGKAEKRKGIYYEFDSEDEPLGVGGMGKVYKGRCVDERNGVVKNVAIKFMYDDLPPYAIEKARREAAIQFRHENLVEMLGFIETEDANVLGEVQHHYHVVSELLQGVSLDSLFTGKLVDQQGNFVPFAEKLFRNYQQDVNRFSVGIVKNILSGLMMMHDAGFIHRDIDPTNIMITADGHVKLIDFGIAKQIKSLTTNDKHLTQAGQFIGKPEYAAPELVLGAIDEQNQTTDIYAVGILLFQCLVGHVPFEGDRSDILQKQLHSPLPLKLVKHKGLRKIIAKATEKSRAKRYQSAAEFRVALEQVDLNGSGFEWKPLYNYIIGGVAVCLVGVGGFTLLSGGNNDGKSTPSDIQATPYYSSAMAELNSPATVADGLKKLNELSANGNDSATYMLSRLMFRSKMVDDFCPDSIKRIQNSTKMSVDNNKAHDLLVLTIEQNPNNYHALYELACDYWKADQRTEAVSERDGVKAEKYFNQARIYAAQAHDATYLTMIDAYLAKITEWKENLQKINSKN